MYFALFSSRRSHLRSPLLLGSKTGVIPHSWRTYRCDPRATPRIDVKYSVSIISKTLGVFNVAGITTVFLNCNIACLFDLLRVNSAVGDDVNTIVNTQCCVTRYGNVPIFQHFMNFSNIISICEISG